MKYYQTFITDHDMRQSAQNLDDKRLGKQRVEAIQIGYCLLIAENNWKNHPAVKMWNGWEPFLVYQYLRDTMLEWDKRGFQNLKCLDHFSKLDLAVRVRYGRNCIVEKPTWITDAFILSHKSNLIRKNPKFYRPVFGNDIPDNLPYIWPEGEP